MKPGIIDIGSNSVRMAWLEGAPHYGTLPEERLRYSRFAENATAAGALEEAAVARTIDAVQSLLAEARRKRRRRASYQRDFGRCAKPPTVKP